MAAWAPNLRLLILGRDNPRPGTEESLGIERPGSTGFRLARWLELHCGWPAERYLSLRRMNIDERPAVDRGDVVVALGVDVWRALGMPDSVAPMGFHRMPADDLTFYRVPHPSGRSTFYNDPARREEVARLIARLDEETRR